GRSVNVIAPAAARLSPAIAGNFARPLRKKVFMKSISLLLSFMTATCPAAHGRRKIMYGATHECRRRCIGMGPLQEPAAGGGGHARTSREPSRALCRVSP